MKTCASATSVGAPSGSSGGAQACTKDGYNVRMICGQGGCLGRRGSRRTLAAWRRLAVAACGAVVSEAWKQARLDTPGAALAPPSPRQPLAAASPWSIDFAVSFRRVSQLSPFVPALDGV